MPDAINNSLILWSSPQSSLVDRRPVFLIARSLGPRAQSFDLLISSRPLLLIPDRLFYSELPCSESWPRYEGVRRTQCWIPSCRPNLNFYSLSHLWPARCPPAGGPVVPYYFPPTRWCKERPPTWTTNFPPAHLTPNNPQGSCTCPSAPHQGTPAAWDSHSISMATGISSCGYCIGYLQTGVSIPTLLCWYF